MARYPEAQWRPLPGAGTYTGGPKRLVLHTTEGWSIESAEAAYRAKDIAPHFTVDFAARRWVQHIDTASSSSAMRNEPGGVQTNRDGAIQIEIVGFAAHTQDMADDDLRWLGRIVLTVCSREGIDPRRHPAFVGTEAGTIATTTAPQRMTDAAWDAFDGVCGHQHVPENHHWDPGRFPYDRMLALAEGADPGDDMPLTEAEWTRLGALLTQVAGPRTIVNVAERSELWSDVKTIKATVARLAATTGDVDETEIARLVLEGLDPAAIAAAIPTTIAADVVDELHRRTAT